MNILRIITRAVAAAFLFMATYAYAAPQSGTWFVTGGADAYGGNIINIDVQNDQVFIIFAVGEVPNNTSFLYGQGTLNQDNIEVPLISSQDGSVRTIRGHFDNSSSGVIDFPGVGQRAVARAQLQDETQPQSLLGGWSVSHFSAQTGVGNAAVVVLTQLAPGTSTGTGLAIDESGSFGCEYQNQGDAAGVTLCVDISNPSVTRAYILFRTGDEAGGIYIDEYSSDNIALVHRFTTSDLNTIVLPKKMPIDSIEIANGIRWIASEYKTDIKALAMRNY